MDCGMFLKFILIILIGKRARLIETLEYHHGEGGVFTKSIGQLSGPVAVAERYGRSP